MSNFLFYFAIFFTSIHVCLATITVDSSLVEKFNYLNVPPDPLMSQEERNLRVIIFDSIKSHEVDDYAMLINDANLRNNFFSLSVLANLVSRFSQDDKSFDYDKCMRVIIAVLDSRKNEPSRLFSEIFSVSKLVDSTLISYLNSLDVELDARTIQVIEEMNRKWLEKQRYTRKSLDSQDQNNTKHHDVSISPLTINQDQKFTNSYKMLIALFFLIVLAFFAYSAYRRANK